MAQVQATVTELVGQAFILRENGEKVALKQGDVLQSGNIIMTESGSQLVAQGPDFKLELEEDSLTEIPSQPLTESATNAPAILGTGGDEVAALQAAILDGLDPTQAFEAAAAGIPGAGAIPEGTAGGGSGNGGFVTVARTGNAQLGEAGFDTAVGPLVFDEIPEIPGDNLLAVDVPVVPEFPIDPEIPNQAPVATEVDIEGYENSFGPEVTAPDGSKPIIIELAATDTDGTIESFIIKSLPENGVLEVNGVPVTAGDSISASDQLIFIPTKDWSGVTEFEFQAVDNNGGISDSDVAGITVLPVTGLPDVEVTIVGPPTLEIITINTETLKGYGVVGNNGTITGDGFTLKATNIITDPKNPDDPSISVINPGDIVKEPNINGFGVSGKPLGGKSDTVNPEEITPGQSLTITFDQPVSELTAQFSWLKNNEEYAIYTIHKADGTTETGMINGITNKIDPRFTIKAVDGQNITSVDFRAATKGDFYDGNTIKEIQDYRSDFLIHEITFKTANYEYGLEITAKPTDADGSEKIVSITVEAPEGAVLSHGAPGATVDGITSWELPLGGVGYTSTTDSGSGITTITKDGDASYKVIIDALGKVTITGVTITVADSTPSEVTVTAEAQDESLGGYIPPTASGSDNATAAPIDMTSENGLTITDSNAVLEGGNLEFEVTLDKVVDNDTVLHFNFSQNGGPGEADYKDVGTPTVTIDGVAVQGPLVVHGNGSYSVTIPAGTKGGIKISVPTLKDGLNNEGNEDLTLNATLSGETKSGATLTGEGLKVSGTGTIEDYQLINFSNINTKDPGFTVTASGKLTAIAPGGTGWYGDTTNGFGVGYKQFDPKATQISGSEVITITFDQPVTGLAAKFSWFTAGESANITINYADRTSETKSQAGTSEQFDIGDGREIASIVIKAESGDFLINEISYKTSTANYIEGTGGPDTLTGSAESDTIYGGAGDDTVNGDAGDDIISGGAGNDTIDGGAGNDVISGGVGNDILNGGDGNNTLYGGDGNDTIFGGTGADEIYGGLGDDTIDLSGLISGTHDGAEDILYWTKAEADSGQTQNDKVISFDVDTDKLDLSDFLTTEEQSNLGSYLTAAQDGADTVVKVTSGTGAELNITLVGVGYTGDILEQILTADLVNQLP